MTITAPFPHSSEHVLTPTIIPATASLQTLRGPCFSAPSAASIVLRAALMLTSLLAAAPVCRAEPPPVAENGQVWKTVFYKRAFAGTYASTLSDGINSTIRVRIPIPFEGTKVRLTLQSMRDGETVVSKMSFARGADVPGKTTGASTAITFNGAPGVTLAANGPDVVSDGVPLKVDKGTWYVQESYASEKCLYTYHLDGFFNEAGDRHDAPALQHAKGGLAGNVYRIDVLTEDTRPAVVCYGDSITHGFSTTPNGGMSYPEQLSRLADVPVVNLGINSDCILFSGGAPGLVQSMNGIQYVIVLVGTNDIFTGRVKTAEQYASLAGDLVANLKRNRKVFIGTLPPAGGIARWDQDPAMEKLRQEINAWIRTKSGADAVIDADKALADPANPARMRAIYTDDLLHPNNAGSTKIAELAAALFPKVGGGK